MCKRKKLSELTLKDDFMFGAVMVDPKNCKPMLERILGINIASVEVDREKSIIFHPEYKGIRLDILATDENNSRYNVEMQIVDQHNLPLRSRYYHSQMDMEILARGEPYQNLPSCIVIFICDFDPFHQDLCCYTIEHNFLILILIVPSFQKSYQMQIQSLLFYIPDSQSLSLRPLQVRR